MSKRQQLAEKTANTAFSLLPSDIEFLDDLAARKFRYNRSAAARHIIRAYQERERPAETEPRAAVVA